MVECKNISRAVVEPIMADKAEVHVKESVMAVELERSGPSIFVAGHRP